MANVEMLTNGQFQAVYNVLSLALAAMFATTIFLLVVQARVLPRYRVAVVVSAMVCLIAAYHYFRIFNSFSDAYVAIEAGAPGVQDSYQLVKGIGFNEGYRYVDWLLTVPLLLFETIAVLALPRAVRSSLLWKLIPASALMIILGFPGEITNEIAPKAVWGALSTIPFIYILYVLFVELSRAAKSQPNQVGKELAGLRWLLLATWGVYPISYMFPMFGLDGADSFVYRQIGYSVADVLAKCLFGLLIYKIARIKSFDDDPAFEAQETKDIPVKKADASA
ncbi:MAG: bacteriorhodopsin-like [Candidatus Nanopelagicales bacterium]|nr:bacteriorhodopsin-like [Candidatus Nanopelagicales bacterium]MDP4825838.1 bacteriorhodopsin-like [Candidatus Nanopelagicales bacterium]MDP4887778.1 bacteriorhodopsin-like [Candidatus Nanopelagicales bacterium]